MNDMRGIDCPCGEDPCARDACEQLERADRAVVMVVGAGAIFLLAFSAFVAVRVFRALAG
ncbi:hypothetical protein FHS31_000805 [Sphingomonas vulcanisoli]|uniref:Uncharacterized protein n=1 Tax=Sphingomonas vulcanisoli TaxID=1658060 RepID=A0ABX0TNV7_9SPHN|nr:hypothetical protein [Sphingomonas vulcanisoli]NIJ07209.1 hypothetical protein [Sphingomonas vulcanisoli]